MPTEAEAAYTEKNKKNKKKFKKQDGGGGSSSNSQGKPKFKKLEKNQCANCHKFGHWARNSRQPKKNFNNNTALTVDEASFAERSDQFTEEELYLVEEPREEVLVATKKETLVVDSAFTTTMVKHEEILERSMVGKGQVQLGNKTSIPIKKVSELSLTTLGNNKVTLGGSLVVPNLRRNLISVAKLADAGVITVFDKTRVVFYRSGAKISGVKLQEGSRVGNLYELDIDSKGEALVVSGVDKESAEVELWHARFGHVNFDALELAKRKKLITNLPDLKICESGVIGKQHKKFYTFLGGRAFDVLELVHTDRCGPMES